jgi:hypothetical protein
VSRSGFIVVASIAVPIWRNDSQGSKLVGTYDSQISFGQEPGASGLDAAAHAERRSIVLERQPGADTQGFAGLEDEVDRHWGRLLTAAALSTVLGVGATTNDSAIVTALRRGSTNSLNRTGQQLVRRNLNNSADNHHPARLPGPRDRQPRPRARALTKAERPQWRSSSCPACRTTSR